MKRYPQRATSPKALSGSAGPLYHFGFDEQKKRGPFIPRDPLRIAIFLYIIVSIARVHQLIPGLASLRPGLLLLGVAVGFAFLAPGSVAWKNLDHSWPAKALFAYGLITIFSSFAGLSLGASARYLIDDFSRVLVSTFVVMAAIRTVNDLRFFLWAYVISMALWVYMAFFVFETSSLGSATARLSNLYTYDANDLGLILIMGVGFVLMLFHASEMVGKLACVVVLIGTMSTIALTGSRGALVGLVAVVLFLLITDRHVAVLKRVGIPVVLVVTLMLAAPPGYWDQMETVLNLGEDYNVTSIDGRLQIARRGVGYMLTYPILGVGPNNFGRAEITISDKVFDLPFGAPLRNVAPHNTFVQVGAELGFLGLFVWLYMLVRGGIGGAQIRRRMPKRWRTGSGEERLLYYTSIYFPVAFLGFAVPSLFVSFAYLSPFFLLVAFYAGFSRLAEERLSVERGGAESPISRNRRGGGIVGGRGVP